jgi:hypothetical protein
MNSANKKTPGVQLKPGVTAQRRNLPVAPPVYRPLPVPRVLQQKKNIQSPPPVVRPEHKIIAPAINRPTPRIDLSNRPTIRPAVAWRKSTVQLSQKDPKEFGLSATKIKDKVNENKPDRGQSSNAYTLSIVKALAADNPERKFSVFEQDALWQLVNEQALGLHFSKDKKEKKIKYSFGGVDCSLDTLLEKITDTEGFNANLPSIKQAMNDLDSKGKATSRKGEGGSVVKVTKGGKDVLHASAGKQGQGNGCTLFFTRDAQGNVDIVGIGQHEASDSYRIYYGNDLLGARLQLA